MDVPKPLILVVDDDPAFREIFAMKLQAAGYEVQTADDGVTGVERIKQLKPDLVLMDMKMPGMTGAETLLSMSSDPELKGLKVIFISSLGDAQDYAQDLNSKFAQQIGALGYIRKTDDLDSIVEKVREMIAKK